MDKILHLTDNDQMVAGIVNSVSRTVKDYRL